MFLKTDLIKTNKNHMITFKTSQKLAKAYFAVEFYIPISNRVQRSKICSNEANCKKRMKFD